MTRTLKPLFFATTIGAHTVTIDPKSHRGLLGIVVFVNRLFHKNWRTSHAVAERSNHNFREFKNRPLRYRLLSFRVARFAACTRSKANHDRYCGLLRQTSKDPSDQISSFSCIPGASLGECGTSTSTRVWAFDRGCLRIPRVLLKREKAHVRGMPGQEVVGKIVLCMPQSLDDQGATHGISSNTAVKFSSNWPSEILLS